MDAQLQLFGDTDCIPTVARARHTDPATSHAAAAQTEASGVAESRRAKILASLKNYPGQMYRELAKAVKLDPVECMRRLNDLERASLVRKGKARICTADKSFANACSTWHAVNQEPTPCH